MLVFGRVLGSAEIASVDFFEKSLVYPPLKLTFHRLWKWMVGRWGNPFGFRPIFRGFSGVLGSVGHVLSSTVMILLLILGLGVGHHVQFGTKKRVLSTNIWWKSSSNLLLDFRSSDFLRRRMSVYDICFTYSWVIFLIEELANRRWELIQFDEHIFQAGWNHRLASNRL